MRSTLKLDHLTRGDQLPRVLGDTLGCELADALLKHPRAQLALAERRTLAPSTSPRPAPATTPRRRAARRPAVRPAEPLDIARGSTCCPAARCSHVGLQLGATLRRLRLPVLELHVAKLIALRRPAIPRTETLRREPHLTTAPTQRIPHTLRDPGDLEVALTAARSRDDLIPLLLQLLARARRGRTRPAPAPHGTTGGSRPPRTAHPRAPPPSPRHGYEAAGPAHRHPRRPARSCDETPPRAHPARWRAPVRPRPRAPPRPHRADAQARARPPDRARAPRPRAAPRSQAPTPPTDFGALKVKSIPPARRPSAPARRMNSPLTGWRPSINATSCSARTASPASRPEPLARLIEHVPDPLGLRRLTRRGEVVVPARRCDRPRLQVGAVARRLPRTDARSRHHRPNVPP